MKKTLGIALIVIVSLYGFYIEISILNFFFGLIGILISLVLLPVIYAVVPIYLLFNGNWMPILVIYGGIILGFYLSNAGKKEGEGIELPEM